MYLFNTNDEVLDSFPLYPKSVNNNYVCFSSVASRMKFNNNKLIIPTNAKIKQENGKYFDLAGIVVDLKNKKVKKFGRYSDKKLNGTLSYTRPYNKFDVFDNKVIFSSEEDENIYEYNIDTEEYKTYKTKSKYIDSIPVIPDSMRKNRLFVKNYAIQEPRYGSILYINNKILRFVKHKTTIPKSKGLYKGKRPSSQYSVIIFAPKKNEIIDEIMVSSDVTTDFILGLKNQILFINKKSAPLVKTGKLCIDFYGIK